MRRNKFLRLMVVVALTLGNHPIRAHDFGLEYDSEWQADFKGGYNWLNLLKLSATVDINDHFSLQGSTISIANTGKEPLVDDLQGYSNIEEDNLPLAFAVLGAELRVKESSFFLGIRNVNEDYFTSPVTSFFINSSCGIFPTISSNCNIANYPLSSWCFHYKLTLDRFVVQTSLYDGRGHKRIAGEDNIFMFSPSKTGLFSITSAEYINNGSNYSLGCAVHYGVCGGDEEGDEDETTPTPTSRPKKTGFMPWVNIEQRLTGWCDLMFQGSFSSRHGACRYYLGAGAKFSVKDVELGIFSDFAKWDQANECATELTCKIQILPQLFVQPTVEVICTGSRVSTVGLMRLGIRI